MQSIKMTVCLLALPGIAYGAQNTATNLATPGATAPKSALVIKYEQEVQAHNATREKIPLAQKRKEEESALSPRAVGFFTGVSIRPYA